MTILTDEKKLLNKYFFMMTELTTIYGMRVMVSEYTLELYQYKFPKSKKKRIRKKWAKRAINLKARPGAYIIDNKFDTTVGKEKILVCHPLIMAALKERAIKQQNYITREGENHEQKTKNAGRDPGGISASNGKKN